LSGVNTIDEVLPGVRSLTQNRWITYLLASTRRHENEAAVHTAISSAFCSWLQGSGALNCCCLMSQEGIMTWVLENRKRPAWESTLYLTEANCGQEFISMSW